MKLSLAMGGITLGSLVDRY